MESSLRGETHDGKLNTLYSILGDVMICLDWTSHYKYEFFFPANSRTSTTSTIKGFTEGFIS